MKLNLKPKRGSPRSCRCSQVSLSGRYSAGVLVKCEHCMDVRRATQKNSCPYGFKIFSPASPGDWRTLKRSGVKALRNPHWIMDVTRPQRGCGGCRNSAMNSRNPKQATWRTRDGSPWWLRNSRYGEPNGDYHANCFLYINNNPRGFNDHNCAYHSRSYYCQPVRNNPLYGFKGKRAPKARKPKRRPQKKRGSACTATLYKHSNFRGRRGQFKVGSYNFRAFTRKVKNDDVSSIYVHGKNCVAKMYQHGGFNGWAATYRVGNRQRAGWRYVGNRRNDQASSLKVYKDDCTVVIYQHSNYRGRRARFTSGNYRHRQFTRRGVRNDALSSLRIYGKHCVCDMYVHGSFNGARARYSTGNRNSRHIRYVGGRWNDKFSSMRVFKR
jgi:hypothetical protein